jgi:AraC-like DNA-binding protein
VRRFQQAQALMRQVPQPDWARLAAECGYFDQSHLILDFRHFAGFTPAELQRRSRSVEFLGDHLVAGEAANASGPV